MYRKEKEMKKQDAIVPFSLGCMLYGIWVSFCEIFGCRVDLRSYLLTAFVVALVVFFLFFPWRWKVTSAILVSSLGLLSLYSLRNIERLRKEMGGLLYYVDKRSEAYSGSVIFGTGHLCSMEGTLLWVLLGALFGVFITLFAFRMRSLQYGLLPCYLVLCAGLLLGRAPGIRGMFFMLLGTVSAMFWLNGQDRGGRAHFHMLHVKKDGAGWHRYVLFFSMFAVVFLLASHFTVRNSKKILSHEREVQRAQTKLERQVTQTVTDVSKLINGSLSIDNNGKLTNDEPKYADRTVLKVTTGWKPDSDVYLKGFAGIHYKNGEWSRDDGKSFCEAFPDEENRRQLASLGYNYFCADAIDKIMQVEHVGSGRWSSYTYQPYFTDIGSVTDTDEAELLSNESGDYLKTEASSAKVCQKYSMNYTSLEESELWRQYRYYHDNCVDEQFELENGDSMVYKYYDFSDVRGHPLRGNDYDWKRYLNFDRKKVNEFYNTYSDYFDMGRYDYETLPMYMDYAWKEYGYNEESSFFDLDSFRQKLRHANGYYEEFNYTESMNTWDRVVFVRGLLKDEAKYSKKIGKLPAGADYAEYFLLEQKQGFCEHFATAGTLLMRELGIPARYIGGYKIPADRFQKNDDGTYTAEVLDSDAHAWTEVLTGMPGWFPVDMTPSSDSTQAKKKKGMEESASPTATPRRDTEETEKPTPTVKPTPTAEPSATPARAGDKRKTSETGEFSGGLAVLWRVIAVAAGIAAVAALWIFGWRIYYRSRRMRRSHLAKKSRNLYVRMELHELLSYMRSCGVAVSARMPEADWRPVLEAFCAQLPETEESLSASEQEELLRIVQKAAFSKEEITQEECDAFRKFTDRLIQIVQKKAGKLRRAYLKLTGRYGKI